MSFERICPKCGGTVQHKSEKIRHEAVAKGQTCLGCRPTKRKLTSAERLLRRVLMTEYQREYRRVYRNELTVSKRAYNQRIKEEGILAYGGRCSCCGESTLEFLTLEHIGGRIKGELRLTGKRMWAKAKREGYPKDKYTVLCFNCNCSKGAFGYCPHQKQKALCV